MNNYIKNDEIWICPTAFDEAEPWAYGYRQTWKPRVDASKGDAFGDPPIAGLKLRYIERNYGPLSKKIAWYCQAYGDLVKGKYYPHSKGSNYIYLDGHAEWSPVGHYWAPPGYPAPGMDPPTN
jgi:prepilin-type processing-associated H-X9-DG protein